MEDKTTNIFDFGSEPLPLPYRAKTEEQKKECLEKILEVWKRFPDLRLGQLLVNSMNIHCPQVFYAEDLRLAEDVVKYGERWKAEASHSSSTKNEDSE